MEEQFIGSLDMASPVTQQKENERVRRRYELLSEQTRDIILFVRIEDGALVEANRAACDAYGYPRDELLKKNIFDLRAQDQSDIVKSQMQRANVDGNLFQAMHVRHDGTAFPVEVSSRGVQVGDERMLLSVIRDMTERQQTETILRESEERHRQISELMSDYVYQGIVLPDRTVKTEWISGAFEHITGYSISEVLNAPAGFLGLVVHEDVERVLDQNQQMLNQGSIVHEYRIRRKDGELRWLRDHIKFVAGADLRQPIYILGGVHDITEQKRVEDALRASEAKFFKIFQASPAIIAIAEEITGKYVEVNETWLDTMEFTQDEIIGRPPSELNVFADADQYRSAWQSLREQGSLREHEMTLRTKSGKIIECIFSAEWIELQGKRYLLTAANNITARKRAETLVAEQLAELQRWSKAHLGRETRVVEIKREVNELLRQMGQPIRYASVESEKS